MDYEVWVFGSRAHGRGLKPFSDLDIALIIDKPMDVSHYGTIKEAFNEFDLPIRVDVMDWSRIQASYQEIIYKEHIKIQ